MFGPFLCTFLVNYVDYVQLFRLASIIPLLGLVPFLLVRRESSSDRFEKRNSSLRTFLKVAVSSRNMLVLSYLRLAFSFTNAFFVTFLAVHAENNLLLTPFLIALLFGMKGIANTLSRIPSGKFADKIGCKWPIVLAFTMLSLAYFMISETGNIYLLVIAMAIYGTAHGMRAVTEWSLLGDCAPSGMGSIATAYLSTIFNVGAAVGGVAAGVLSLIVNIPTIFKAGSLIILTGTLTVALIKTGN